jgi:hypothetical protein
VENSLDGIGDWKMLYETERESPIEDECAEAYDTDCPKETDGQKPWSTVSSLKDINKDGFFEVVVLDVYHMGNVNTPFDIYAYNPKTHTVYHSLSSGGVAEEFVHGALVVSARESAASYGFSVYQGWPVEDTLQDEADMIIIAEIWFDENDKKKGSLCRFTDGQGQLIHPPKDRFWLKYCRHYGKKYRLIKGEQDIYRERPLYAPDHLYRFPTRVDFSEPGFQPPGSDMHRVHKRQRKEGDFQAIGRSQRIETYFQKVRHPNPPWVDAALKVAWNFHFFSA